jgi:hypothetical protein
MPEISPHILDAISKYIKRFGVKKTLKHLSLENKNEKPLFHGYVNDVLTNVCESFSINIEDLLNSKYVRGDQKYAIGFCVHYLYPEKSLTEICQVLFVNRNKTILSKYKNIIEHLNTKHKSDQKYLKIKETLDKKLIK